MRDKILAEKSSAIQKELEVWAIEQKILKAGECLLFSLRIGKTTLVVREDVVQLLEMNPRDFFSGRRFELLGVPGPLATRISGAVWVDCRGEWKKNKGWQVRIRTMREWLEAYDSTSVMRIPNLGKKSIEWIIRLIHENGLQFSDE